MSDDIDPEIHRSFGVYLTRLKRANEELDATRRDLDGVQIELDKVRAQLSWTKDELERRTRSRDEHQMGFYELKAQLAILVSTAMANHATNQGQYDTFIKLAEGAMQSVRDRMIKAGVDPADEESKEHEARVKLIKDEEQEKMTEEAMRKLAQKFGASNRPETAEEP
jgi:septal ring factor EnvC (AmiA/AmiB activator)